MDKLMLGGQGYSLEPLSDEELASLIEKGPDEIEEEQRADEIEVISGVRLKRDRGRHDDYEEGLDEYNDAVDARYFEEQSD